jgi:hypothetical protein
MRLVDLRIFHSNDVVFKTKYNIFFSAKAFSHSCSRDTFPLLNITIAMIYDMKITSN